MEESIAYPDYTVGRLSPPDLMYDAVRNDFTVAGDGMMVCDRFGPDDWACEVVPFGYGVYNGASFARVDGTGEFFYVHTTEAERDIAVARRPPGGSWSQEHVDYWRQHGFQTEPWQQAYLAFDLLDLPTLSWTWSMGHCCEQDEYHLYFAWKTAP